MARKMFGIVASVSLILTLVLTPNLAIPAYANPDTIIDTFDTSQTVLQTGLGSTSGTADTAGSDILGVERDIQVFVTAIGSGNNLRAEANGGSLGRLAHSQDADVKGLSLLTYDGNDNDGATLSFGLGNLNLNPDNAFVIELISADLGVTGVITFYTNDASSCSRMSKSLPAISSSDLKRAVVFPFSSFTQCAGATSAASVGDIDAIQLLIDGTANASADVTIDLFRTATVDYGDLPNILGITRLSQDGAGHVIGSLYLGSSVDGPAAEDQGTLGNNAATGDDNNTSDDENGVVRTPGVFWRAGSPPSNGGSVDVTVTGGNSCLSGWIDWAGDGFVEPEDYIINNQAVTAGPYTFVFSIPSDPAEQTYYARFRLFPRDPDDTCTTAKGLALQYPNGEVEDYQWSFGPTAITFSTMNATSSTPNLWLLAALLTVSVLVGGWMVWRKAKQ